MYQLIVKNGTLVTADSMFQADIGIKNGTIVTIAKEIEEGAIRVIDASNQLVFPGFIDSHIHSSVPGFEHYEDFQHITSAAAAGGATTVIDMPGINNPTCYSGSICKTKKEKLKNTAKIDYALWGGCFEGTTQELPGLIGEGVVALKGFMCPGDELASLGAIREELTIIKDMDMVAGFHCEDPSIIAYEEKRLNESGDTSRAAFLKSRPVISEVIATQNVIELAKETGAKIHICHVTHTRVAEVIKRAKQEGVKVTAETCGNYLMFDEQDLLQKGALYKCTPPLREAYVKEELWKYVVDGTIDCISSDHSPTTFENKDEEKLGIFGIWAGVMSAQSLFQVVFHEAVTKRHISPTVLSRACSKAPAKIFGLDDRKGFLQCGYDGDLTIVDPDKDWKIETKDLLYVNKMSAYVGLEGKGCAVCTISKGNVIALNGKIVEEEFPGELLTRKTERRENLGE